MNGDLDLKKRQNLLTRIKSTFHYTWTIVSETGPKRKSMFTQIDLKVQDQYYVTCISDDITHDI